MIEDTFLVNGLSVHASFSEEAVFCIFLPLLEKLTELYRLKNRRIIAFLAGPPAAGKSTLAAFLERLSVERQGLEPLQAAGIDGFHYHADYIERHTVLRDGAEVPMKSVKGCPESYDVRKLAEAVGALRSCGVKWPRYDRRLHDVAEDSADIRANIVLIEGNWLLLAGGEWAALRNLSDYAVMVRSDEGILRERCIQRKVLGGLAPREAEEFYRSSDRRNILRCLSESAPADMNLTLGTSGRIERA